MFHKRGDHLVSANPVAIAPIANSRTPYMILRPSTRQDRSKQTFAASLCLIRKGLPILHTGEEAEVLGHQDIVRRCAACQRRLHFNRSKFLLQIGRKFMMRHLVKFFSQLRMGCAPFFKCFVPCIFEFCAFFSFFLKNS